MKTISRMAVVRNLKRLIREQDRCNGDYETLYFGLKNFIENLEASAD